MKKRLVEMKKGIESLDETGNKDISLENVFRIMAKSIINYSRPQNSVDINNTKKVEEQEGTLPIAADTKNCAKRIATDTLARDVRVGSSEIKENYNELVNPIRATEDKSIDE